MAVDAGRLADLAAEQVIHGHAGHLALDVPEGLVHAGDGVVEHGAVAPIGADHAHLPDVLDAGDVLADEQGLHVIRHRMGNGHPPLGVGGAADAVQAGLRGDHLDDNEGNPFRCGANRVNVLDRYHCFSSLRMCSVSPPQIQYTHRFYHFQYQFPMRGAKFFFCCFMI